ncbi:uncharacterized protein LOC126882588 [Diabrotica virgifera virgifera]|uniref:Uncharacterized protein n=1 Tax=Diabrotica virgifera virgifera TaxID=50390 RepID=A0ABM5K003_DIAVI|nr:uncharacterized protein LOC126882588 [Diabrotica virgifera virgifera]
MTLYQIAECAGTAHSKSMTPENIMNGFKSTGIYPFNKHIFSETDFLLSSVTARQINDFENYDGQKAMVVLRDSTNHEENASVFSSSVNVASTSSNTTQETEPNSTLEIPSTSKNSFITPFDIRGFPKAAPRKNSNRRRKSRKSVILTSTPEMKDLSYKTEGKKTPTTAAVNKVKRNISKALSTKACKKDSPRKKTKSGESDSETDSGSLELADSSDDELSSPMMQEQKDDSESYAIAENTEILKDSFVLVKFEKNIHYVAKILEIVNSYEFKISYLRRSTKVSNSFYFPDIPDIHMGLKSDFVMLLPAPIYTKNKRLSCYYRFGLEFNNFIVR